MKNLARLLFISLFAFLVFAACEQRTGQATDAEGEAIEQAESIQSAGDRFAGMTQEEIMREVLGTAPYDEFNPDVAEAERGKLEPKAGGSLRVRSPSDFEGFNPLLSSTVSSRNIEVYLFGTMVEQDSETLEYYPSMAWTWRVGDLMKFPDQEIVEGTIIEGLDGTTSDTVVRFAPNAFRQYFSKADVANMDAEAGVLTLKEEFGGATYHGAINEKQYVYEVNEATASEDLIETTLGELDYWVDTVGTRRSRPFLKQSSAFYFTMRPGVEWHDGEPVTAEDVLFGYHTVMNVNVEAQRLRNYLQDVTLAEIVDGDTVHFQAARPYYQMFDALIGILPILPKHVFNPEQYGGDARAFAEAFNTHAFRERPIGNGPFKMSQWKKEDYVRLVRNDNYWKNKLPDETIPQWRKGQPYLNEITWILIRDKAAAVKEMQKGNIDFDDNIVADTWLQQDTNTAAFKEKFVRVRLPGFGWTYIGWNNASPMFSDPATRGALSKLIPRDRIIEDIHHGLHDPVNGPFFNRGPEYDTTIDPIEYDPQQAIRELRKLGWLDRNGDGIIEKEINGRMVPFKFEYLIHNALDYHQKVADIIKESVEQAGISVDIRKLDWANYSDYVRDKKFDALRFAWSSSPDSDPYQIWHSSQSENKGDNFLSYKNERVDQLLEKIREEFDPLKRWEMKREIHGLMYEDQPVTFMFAISEMFFYNRDLRGIKFYPSFLPVNFSQWWWADEARRNAGGAQ